MVLRLKSFQRDALACFAGRGSLRRAAPPAVCTSSKPREKEKQTSQRVQQHLYVCQESRQQRRKNSVTFLSCCAVVGRAKKLAGCWPCLIASRLKERGATRRLSLLCPPPPQPRPHHRRQALVVLSDVEQTLRPPMAFIASKLQVFNLTFLRLVSSLWHGPPRQLSLPPTLASVPCSYRVLRPRPDCRCPGLPSSRMHRWMRLRSLLV